MRPVVASGPIRSSPKPRSSWCRRKRWCPITTIFGPLEILKSDASLSHLQFTTLDLAGVVDSAVVEFESLVHERGIRVDVRAPEGLPPVRADRTKMLQVLRNLLSNSAKFTPSGKAIEIATTWDDDFVRVAVRDEGEGIPPGELEDIFDKFVQSSKHSSGAGGTGLGLAICREIVSAHGGRIWAENRAEGGACLTFELSRLDRVPRTGRGDQKGDRAAA